MTQTHARRTAADDTREALSRAYRDARAFTERLCEPLQTEDYVIQTMPDVSPTKWHLGHTSWFFERMVLQEHAPGYAAFREPYHYLFNSYYNAAGPMHCRPNRGLLSRPTVDEVYAYRRHVDDAMLRLMGHCSETTLDALRFLVALGVNHEQQHQELIVADLKHVFSSNPLLPAYRAAAPPRVSDDARGGAAAQNETTWRTFPAGVRQIGRDANAPGTPAPPGSPGFAFDNESPRHKVYLEPFALADRPVTNRQFLAFIDDGGYDRHELWLSLGWATVQERGWRGPIYWFRDEASNGWMHYTLRGPEPVGLDEPVCHLSLFEADAFARWAGARLPTEAEWEVAAEASPIEGHFADELDFHPRPGAASMFGGVWEWTSSSYAPYPGYRPWPGAVGEYNGKFMCNQYVLRGGSCATPRTHLRHTYRNFFAPDARWQFTGLRLARDLEEPLAV